VPIDETRAIFEEALDVVLRAWAGEEFTHEGRWFRIPRVRLWPVPVRPPGAVLLHAVNSPESMARAIDRGLPALMARPLSPFADQVAEFARYRARWSRPPSTPSPSSRARPSSSTRSRRRAPRRGRSRAPRSSGTWRSSSISRRRPRPRCRAATLYEKRGGRLPTTPTRTGSRTCCLRRPGGLRREGRAAARRGRATAPPLDGAGRRGPTSRPLDAALRREVMPCFR
jgi:alkanesulfonate monooxygenase SsuD/methylene tetrahydromethanopterin reductase-like flavin-dependent oxidoreductase (luciferase family)